MSQVGILAFQIYLAYIVHRRSSRLDGEVGGGDHTLVFNPSSIPGARPSPTFPNHITHWPFLPPLDACPPSASMVGNLNVGYRGRLFTSSGITQALYFSSRMHLHHGTLDEVLIFCRNSSLRLRKEKFGVDTPDHLRRFMIVEARRVLWQG